MSAVEVEVGGGGEEIPPFLHRPCDECGCRSMSGGYLNRPDMYTPMRHRDDAPEPGCHCRCHDTWRKFGQRPVGWSE